MHKSGWADPPKEDSFVLHWSRNHGKIPIRRWLDFIEERMRMYSQSLECTSLAAKTNYLFPIDLSYALNSASCKKRNGSVYCCDYVVSIVVYISLIPIKYTSGSQTNARVGLQPPSKWNLRIQGEAVCPLPPLLPSCLLDVQKIACENLNSSCVYIVKLKLMMTDM